MEDNEIIIPLKCLLRNESDCRHCKLKDKNDKCQKFLYSDVLGLIDENNRQKAEIERLKISHFQFISDINAYKEKLKTAKAEAVKEFAERLKEKAVDVGICDAQGNGYGGATVILIGDIDNLVKEMEGEKRCLNTK